MPEGDAPAGGDAAFAGSAAPWSPPVAHSDSSPTVSDVAEAGLETAGIYYVLRKLGVLRRRAQEPHGPAAEFTAVPRSEAPDPPPVPRVADDRSLLVAAMVDLEALLRERALREKLHRALARVGVVAVDPVGELFDAEQHLAVGSEPTDVPERHDRIAAVERLGFRDRGRELRPPDVIVWRYHAAHRPGEPR